MESNVEQVSQAFLQMNPMRKMWSKHYTLIPFKSYFDNKDNMHIMIQAFPNARRKRRKISLQAQVWATSPTLALKLFILQWDFSLVETHCSLLGFYLVRISWMKKNKTGCSPSFHKVNSISNHWKEDEERALSQSLRVWWALTKLVPFFKYI